MKKILVLAGGGCRGFAQAQVLKRLEELYGSLHSHYSLICGSSVGAINGSMIASGKITMDRMESIYPEMIKKIFKKNWFPLTVPKYDRKNFIDIFMKEIGVMKMKDCQTKLQITSVNLCDKRNHFFKSWEDEDGEKLLVSQVCKSFAAPYYFGTLADETEQAVYFDGGMGTQNLPLTYALVESQLLWPGEEWHFDIVGCGYYEEKISYKTAKGYKLFRQIGSYFDLDDGGMAREQSRYEQINAMQLIAKQSKKISMCYYDKGIDKKIDKLDGVEFLDQYKTIGIDMANNPIIIN